MITLIYLAVCLLLDSVSVDYTILVVTAILDVVGMIGMLVVSLEKNNRKKK